MQRNVLPVRRLIGKTVGPVRIRSLGTPLQGSATSRRASKRSLLDRPEASRKIRQTAGSQLASGPSQCLAEYPPVAKRERRLDLHRANPWRIPAQDPQATRTKTVPPVSARHHSAVRRGTPLGSIPHPGQANADMRGELSGTVRLAIRRPRIGRTPEVAPATRHPPRPAGRSGRIRDRPSRVGPVQVLHPLVDVAEHVVKPHAFACFCPISWSSLSLLPECQAMSSRLP